MRAWGQRGTSSRDYGLRSSLARTRLAGRQRRSMLRLRRVARAAESRGAEIPLVPRSRSHLTASYADARSHARSTTPPPRRGRVSRVSLVAVFWGRGGLGGRGWVRSGGGGGRGRVRDVELVAVDAGRLAEGFHAPFGRPVPSTWTTCSRSGRLAGGATSGRPRSRSRSSGNIAARGSGEPDEHDECTAIPGSRSTISSIPSGGGGEQWRLTTTVCLFFLARRQSRPTALDLLAAKPQAVVAAHLDGGEERLLGRPHGDVDTEPECASRRRRIAASQLAPGMGDPDVQEDFASWPWHHGPRPTCDRPVNSTRTTRSARATAGSTSRDLVY